MAEDDLATRVTRNGLIGTAAVAAGNCARLPGSALTRSTRVCLVQDNRGERRPRQTRGRRGICHEGGSDSDRAGRVGFIIFNIINRDDVIRYFKMRRM